MALFTLFTGCHNDREPAAARPADPPASQGTIVAVGDSLTAGYGVPPSDAYPALLEKKLILAGHRWQVINAGISGETSSGTLSRIDWILKHKPDIVILETGANDGLRGVAPQLTRRNIDRIVTLFQEKDVVVVLAGMQALRNMGGPFTREFAAIYPAVAKKYDLILVPFFLADVAGDQALNLGDGIHPSAKGYRMITDTIYPYLLQAIERKRDGHR
ncbi:MAG TPA: arylesterase [Geobacter sp.]|nr:arylesterase [Geobacter sp.]